MNLFKGNMLFVAISILIGIATVLISYWVVFLFGVLLLLFYYTNRQRFIFLCLIGLGIGIFTSIIHESANVSSLDGDESHLIGIIDEQLKVSGSFLSFVLVLENDEKVLVNYPIKSREEKEKIESLRYGVVVKVDGVLEKGKGQRMENGFNYQKYLKEKKIHWIMNAKECQWSYHQKSSVLYYFKNKRLDMIQRMNIFYSPISSSFINALLFGDQSTIDETTQKQYQQFGLSHLLAISGSHFTLLIAMVSVVLWRLGLTREKVNVLLLFIVPIYTILAGASPSVLRAGITGTVVVISLFMGYKKLALDILSFVCIGLVLYNPYYIFDIGFQLSFLVSLSLMLSSVCIFKNHISFFQLTIYVTLASQLCSLPIVLEYFYEISPYSLLLNLFFIPFLSFLILPVCIFAYIGTYLFLNHVIDWFLSFLLNTAHQLLNLCEFFPLGRVCFGSLSLWSGLLLWITVYVFFVCWERQQIKKGCISMVLCLSIILVSPYLTREGKVTFLDVGQGDCIVIELPYRKGVYVIDTGGKLPFEKEEWERGKETGVGEKVVVPFLKAQGIRKIDKLIFTHGDYDHIGESDDLLNEFDVKELLVGKKNQRSSLEEEHIQLAKKYGVKVIECEKGMVWEKGGFIFSILTPYELDGDENNQSITVHGTLGEKGFLFTGDLEIEGEKWLVEQKVKKEVDVLKIGHHGSKSSTSQQFLDYFQPSICVISVGENNRYGHPNGEVVERIVGSGCKLLRTDRDGSVQFTFTKNNIKGKVIKQKD